METLAFYFATDGMVMKKSIYHNLVDILFDRECVDRDNFPSQIFWWIIA
jgi:hypothetical protein